MPRRPLKPCPAPACSELIREQRYCDKHLHLHVDRRKQRDEHRGGSTQRGYGYKWQKARKQFLGENPLCVECSSTGRVVLATDVDHKIPRKGDQELFWDRSNWQGLCASHHSQKTAREDGGFGNRPRQQGEGGSKV